ncbi:biotin--[acetyl-CoA-carboxylase] ligase [Prochlorococcus marinus]|uniref:Putative Biotin--acetyl-CoA-carboxylase ligase n=1 Tax=Prochlorococcus marinus (strain MIT 9211) TaxID=93059 RepID=A9BE51_PROM4|nr:biotin--[acetyl-CoA-carboxylase] ligase [Prochlorococcus marinus]ABX08361.1 putative Biotin--acetyl-CoA-carboxylase ligase [Prochlorococcus marinus str. MIT 9211]
MARYLRCKGASSVASWLKINSSRKSWLLRWKPVSGSTETDLSQWLNEKPFNSKYPRAFLAGRQSHGRGQYGRSWHSPQGGVWLSAAIPFTCPKESTGLFGLAVAVALSNRLLNSSVPVQIKWPNDLLVYNRKLAGFLPRVIIKGRHLKFARIGIGLNVFNRVPKGAISLSEILCQGNCRIDLWSAEVLMALENAIMLLENQEQLCQMAESLLWSDQVTDPSTGEIWKIDGFNLNGSLRVIKGSRTKDFYRWE